MHYQFFCEKCHKYIRVPILWNKSMAEMALQHQCKSALQPVGRGKDSLRGNQRRLKHGSER